jgi:A/G-specific adenine glycosylase
MARPNSFRTRLLAWYDTHARKLPWRAAPQATKPRHPYRVWLSEIMLQQTRVAAVVDRYREFLRRFPTVQKLASAREASVLAAWSGLGYYRRARLLHAAAKIIVYDLGGQFPATAEQWRALPGIGRYTSAAIASIAFGEAIAVVDGNVERVLQRVSGQRLAGQELWGAADHLLDRKRPGDFNQAMMELGATVCTPRAPACLTCPLVKLCTTRGEMPRSAKAPRQKKREIHCALDHRSRAKGGGEREVLLVQRSRDARLMAGMWELPTIASPLNLTNNDHAQPAFTLRHSITVTDYTVQVWSSAAPAEVRGEVRGRWIATGQLGQVALTGLARKILRKAGLIATSTRRARTGCALSS